VAISQIEHGDNEQPEGRLQSRVRRRIMPIDWMYTLREREGRGRRKRKGRIREGGRGGKG
jgi:hypothetical protein